jgi:hypothetical protein
MPSVVSSSRSNFRWFELQDIISISIYVVHGQESPPPPCVRATYVPLPLGYKGRAPKPLARPSCCLRRRYPRQKPSNLSFGNSASQHAVVPPPPQHHLRREIHNTKGSSCFDSPLLSCCRRRACARCVDPPYTAQPSSSRLIWTAAVTSIIGRSVAGAGHCRRFTM